MEEASSCLPAPTPHTQPDPQGLLLLTHLVASRPTSPGHCAPSPRGGGIHASISALSPSSDLLCIFLSGPGFSTGGGEHLPREHVMLEMFLVVTSAGVVERY